MIPKNIIFFPDFNVRIIDITSICTTGGYHESALLSDEHHNLWILIGADNVWDGQIKDKSLRKTFFDDKKVIEIHCKGSRSCVVLENGDCYLFGNNVYG